MTAETTFEDFDFSALFNCDTDTAVLPEVNNNADKFNAIFDANIARLTAEKIKVESLAPVKKINKKVFSGEELSGSNVDIYDLNCRKRNAKLQGAILELTAWQEAKIMAANFNYCVKGITSAEINEITSPKFKKKDFSIRQHIERSYEICICVLKEIYK